MKTKTLIRIGITLVSILSLAVSIASVITPDWFYAKDQFREVHKYGMFRWYDDGKTQTISQTNSKFLKAILSFMENISDLWSTFRYNISEYVSHPNTKFLL